MVAFEREWGLVEEHEGNFWGDGHAQDIGKGLSHKGVQIHHNSASVC